MKEYDILKQHKMHKVKNCREYVLIKSSFDREEKDMIYIIASSGKKSEIMKVINQSCGTGTKAGAISFSLPVSEVVGVRRLDDEG